jgi:hypothetical protein
VRTARQIVDEIKSSGRVWLDGEMEFPANLPIHEAKVIAARIAEDCGYLVCYYNGCRSMLQISGGDMPGYVVLDWYDNIQPGPQSVSVMSEDRAYAF